MWHEIAKEGYPNEEEDEYGNVPCYLLTDGEEYYIGFWRVDANAWDNFTTGWVRRYYDPIGSDESLAHITHWMELPALPKDCIDMEQLYEDFKVHVKNMTGKDIKESRDRATTTVEELFGKMRDTTPEENEAIDKYINSISKPTGINIWDLEVENVSKHQSNFDLEEEFEDI